MNGRFISFHRTVEQESGLSAPVRTVRYTGSDGDGQVTPAGEKRMIAVRDSRNQPVMTRITPRVTWADLSLPAPQMQVLHDIAMLVRQIRTSRGYPGFPAPLTRTPGISVLFAGESGTGKDLAAEALACEPGLPLFRIDLSQVVSKYIGETEKNLRRIFDAAEEGGAVLFFDEADALFGKRSDVKDSHDRYAGIELNYLLGQMEKWRGLAVLSTAIQDSCDPVFVRHFRFVVKFPAPRQAKDP